MKTTIKEITYSQSFDLYDIEINYDMHDDHILIYDIIKLSIFNLDETKCKYDIPCPIYLENDIIRIIENNPELIEGIELIDNDRLIDDIESFNQDIKNTIKL